jgi:RNA polymerase sigma-70 factor (TIGR02960 family)
VTGTDLITRALAGDEQAFAALAGLYRRELHTHCYRILGSVQDAEDQVQETLLAAWQHLGGYRGHASIRTWLYQIATNRCLDALRSARRRPPPAAPRPESEPPEPNRPGQPVWLEPYPDALLDGLADSAPGPEARYEATETISLAFTTALQHLPPRQRAVLILRDVLGFGAAEVADMLATSQESVTSALKRARATLRRELPTASQQSATPGSAAEQATIERFARAYQSGDVNELVALCTSDVLVTTPQAPAHYQGRGLAARFLAAVVFGAGRSYLLVPTRANRQPAFGLYVRDPQAGIARASGLLVLTLTGSQISSMTRFDTGVLPSFGLPRTIPS